MTPGRKRRSGTIEQGSSLGRDAWLRLRKNRLAMFSLWFFVVVTVCCLLLPLLPILPNPNITHPDLKSLPAFSTATSMDEVRVFYLLGSDHLGRDIFARILYGGRISLAV